MTALLSPNAKQQFLDNAGNPAAGYKLFTYAANTTTPQATYTNRAGTVANANPIILDARGEATIYLTPGVVYDYVLETPLGSPVWTQEDVSAQAGDASAINFTQAGAGAFERTLEGKLQDETLSVLDFVNPASVDGVLSGTVDASEAFGLAIDEAIARGRGRVTFPAGRFLLSTKVTKTLTGTSGLSIEGAGMGITQLVMADASGDGLEINAAAGGGNWWLNVDPSSALRIANLSILSTVLNLGTGIKINGNSLEGRPPAPCVLDHVEIRAKDSINGQAFLTGLHLIDCGSVFANHCRFLVGGPSNITPTAVKLEATDATTDPVHFNFDTCEWIYGGKGIVAGDHVEGIYLTQCTMLKCDIGVEWTCTAESGLHVSGGHYNCLTRNFELNGVFDFVVSGAVCFLSGGSPAAHLRVQNGNSFSVVGNAFYGGVTGADIGTLPAGARGGYIGANQFSNMTTGVNLSSAANNVTVGLNGYTSVTNRVVGSGGAGSFVQKRSYSVSVVPTLVGGAANETVNVAIPSNTFLAKPSVAVIGAEAGTADYICSYSFSTSTETNLVFRIVRRDGGVIAAGAARFHVAAYE